MQNKCSLDGKAQDDFLTKEQVKERYKMDPHAPGCAVISVTHMEHTSVTMELEQFSEMAHFGV